jgi:hypothetical protein
MGAEVIESGSNWNYSRGLLFDYAIPFFHFGASAKYAFSPKVAVTGFLVNGWNNTIINHTPGSVFTGSLTGASTGLTYGASLAVTPTSQWSIIENYFAGPVLGAFSDFSGASLSDWKQISDTVITYTPNSKWAFTVNGDYGFGPRYYSSCDSAVVRPQVFFTCDPPSPAVNWWGVAGYAKYTLSPKTNFAARYEYYDDPWGYTCVTFCERGRAQEVTGTYSYNLTSSLLVRGEYRYDFASLPIFPQSISNEKSVKEQNTATISFVYSFSSANAK